MIYRYPNDVPTDVRVWVEVNQPSPGSHTVRYDVNENTVWTLIRVWDTGKVEMK